MNKRILILAVASVVAGGITIALASPAGADASSRSPYPSCRYYYANQNLAAANNTTIGVGTYTANDTNTAY